MKLISVAIFSFAIVLLALAFGLKGPGLFDHLPTAAAAEAQQAVETAPPVPQTLDSHSREALDSARRQLASALQVRTEAESARDTARAHVMAAREAFEAAMLELTEAETRLETAAANPKSRRVKTADRIMRKTREATVGAEARLREAKLLLEQAEAAYDQSEASMSQARASLQAVTAQGHAIPRPFESV